MTKPHKHASDSIVIETKLNTSRIGDIAVAATQGIKSTSVGINGVTTGQKIVVAANGPAATVFMVKNALGAALMQFTLSFSSLGDGRTRATSSIDEYTTTKQTVMFIPVTPRTMDGFHMYEAWSKRVGEMVRTEDKSARITSTMAV